MYLANLRLYDFRNFAELDVALKEGINVFHGDNAQGKTNILEAIFFLSTLKPARAFREQELVRHEKPLAFVKGIFNTASGSINRQVTVYRDRKKTVQEGESVKTKWSELSPSVSAVYFSPEDIDIVKGQPAGRRRFIDNIIYQARPGFYKYLQGYQRVLTQRNMLLKAIKSKPNLAKTLDSWDEQLSEFGTQLICERLKVLKQLSSMAEAYFREFTQEGQTLKIRYKSEIDVSNIESIKEDFKKKLEACRKKDMQRSYTTVGPHRDDIDFFIEDKYVKYYGSQGQQRLVVLCLKFAQRNLLYTEKGEYPILLLDDVMSELDIHRRQLILEQENHQVFITTTDLKLLPEDILKKSFLYCVKAGALR
ncbi:MAG: DNA replication/repair protein RecF [Thermoanaerobacteraceae bacterium]|nr:DNA replication/repair protein RecF [Thermoanaerobacteraceae bacterium]